MPKVSVLMPIYKTNEIYLREAIESILVQTFADFEFLILDDCPDDSRENIVKSYTDQRIKYIKNEKNLGISQSRNKLIELAKGEYLAVFDHDDISLPKRFEKEVAFLDEHPEIGVVGCWYERFPKYKIKKRPEINEQIENFLMQGCGVLHPAAMIRKSVLTQNNICYEEEFSPAEDYALFSRLIGKTKFYNLQEILYRYRDHEINTSKTQKEKMADVGAKVQALVKALHPEIYERTHQKRFQRKFLFGTKFDVIVPLGSDCGCAGCLKDYKLRYFSYPFDWLFKISFENRIQLIENHFNDFLVKENLVALEKDPNAVLVDNENDYYEDVKYGTQFLHDFIHGMPLDMSYQTVKDKYDRRIQRLYDNIEKSQNVLFVWRDKNHHLLNNDIENAYQRLSAVFAGKNIFLLVIESNNVGDDTISKEVLNSHIIRITANISKTAGTTPYDIAKGNKVVSCLIFRQIKCKKEPFSFRAWFWKKYIKLFCSLIKPVKKRKLIKAYLNNQLLSVRD